MSTAKCRSFASLDCATSEFLMKNVLLSFGDNYPLFFFLNDPPTPESSPFPHHAALPFRILAAGPERRAVPPPATARPRPQSSRQPPPNGPSPPPPRAGARTRPPSPAVRTRS